MTTKEEIILIHGLNSNSKSFFLLNYRLGKDYTVYAFNYSINTDTIEEITKRFIKFIFTNVKTAKYHIISQSLGCVITRNIFKHDLKIDPQSIIMITPPNKPPVLAKRLRDWKLFKWYAREAGQKLASDEFYKSLPIPNCNFGVIAGNKFTKWFGDGYLHVENTKLEKMSDWICLKHTHPMFSIHKDVYICCVNYLKTGNFIAK